METFISGLILGLLVAYFFTKNYYSKTPETETNLAYNYVQKIVYDDLQKQSKTQNQEIISLNSQLSTYKEKANNLETKLKEHQAEFDEIKSKMTLEFKLLTNQIFEEKSSKFLALNEKNVFDILNPLKERIKEFESKVDKNYNEDNKDKASLKKELEMIIQLNKQVSDDTNRLTNALKGDKKFQGNWGEIQLEMILNKAGLEKGIHYRSQETFEAQEGKNMRPDYILNLPDSKHLILDSKVSLVAYEQYYNEENDILKLSHLKNHVSNINKHISDLSSKNYQKLASINAPDYVLMFIPMEQALYAALTEDSNIFEKALDKNIVLVSTSTLLATLRTINFMWKQEKQRNNVSQIAEESGQLYDKFVGFVEDLINLGRKLDGVKLDYNSAMGKLTESKQKGSTIVGRLERIKTLGANATKSIPPTLFNQIEE